MAETLLNQSLQNFQNILLRYQSKFAIYQTLPLDKPFIHKTYILGVWLFMKDPVQSQGKENFWNLLMAF